MLVFQMQCSYQKIIKSMPIFCIDFLISFQNKYLLIKRKEEPLKNLYWVIGGRLMFKEKITHAAKRIQEREIGTYFSNFTEIGFSNYFFPDKQNSRATHTPTLLFHIALKKTFNPILEGLTEARDQPAHQKKSEATSNE